MSMKPIAVAVSMLAMVVSLTAAQASPSTSGGQVGSQVAGPRQAATVPLALLILGPHQNAVG